MKLRDLFDLTDSSTIVNSFWQSRFQQNKIYPLVGVDIIFANGKRIRMSTQSVTLYDSNNSAVVYEPLLINEPNINESYDWKGGSPSQRSFTVSIDGRRVNALDIVFGGNMLAGSAELSLIDDDVPYEKRFVFMIGDMISGVSFGADRETVEVTISDPKLTVDKIIPEYITTEESLPDLPENQQSQRYPLIFNRWNKVPAIMIDMNILTPKYLVAYSHDIEVKKVFRNGTGTVSEADATMNGLITNPSLYQWRVIYEYDELSRPYTGIEFVDSPNYIIGENTFTDSDTVYCDVIKKNDKFTVIDLAVFLLSNYTEFGIKGIDEVLTSRSKLKEPQGLSSNVCINGSGDNVTTTMEFISSTLLGSFPMIQLAYSAQGIGLVFTDRNPKYSVLSLVSGQNLLFDRVSGFTESSREEIYNKFTLQYDYNAMNDNYNKTIERNSTNHNLCKLSEQKIGIREMEPVLAINVFDDTTAQYIIDWLSNHYTFPTYTVEYEGSPKLFFLLKVGDNIQLSDEKLNISNINGTVESLSYQRGKVSIVFKLWILFDVINGYVLR